MVTGNDIQTFYARPHVRRRIAEYLGAENGHPATCVYLAQPDGGWPRMDTVSPPDRLPALLRNNLDLARSLWDRQSLIAHLDIEYVNFEFQREPYLDPARSFRVQKPARLATERILSRYGIHPLHLVTGRGHHYTWRIQCGSAAFRQLADFGRCNDTLLARYRSPGLPLSQTVSSAYGKAFAGLGLVLEYIADTIKAEAAPASSLPVEITAVAVGPGERGREIVSIDVSEYGDPLYLRVVRAPFTAYLKKGARDPSQDEAGGGGLLTVVAPHNKDFESVFAATRNATAAVRLAAETTAGIPDATSGTHRLIRDYANSPLRRFHDRFYEQPQHPPHAWEGTYDRMPIERLPPCIAHILSVPNDLLMQPAAIELVVRGLLALNWHPRHIAGLIRSKYERDYGWGDQWLIHDAATRADFYTRIFAGLFAAGVDDLVDFNCTSVREKGLCLRPQNGCALTTLRTSLLERRHHDRLADRPLDGLLLPHEHL
jgi:hypothetical protein